MGSYFVLKYEDVINLQLGGGFATSILLSLVCHQPATAVSCMSAIREISA